MGALRYAADADTGARNQEHVTYWLRRQSGSLVFDLLREELDASYLRCTLDTSDDYENLYRLLRSIDDPISVSWRSLVARLRNLPDAPPRSSPQGAKLALGTAQLAKPYGTLAKTTPPTWEESLDLVRSAARAGVRWIDTARAYTGSEERLGTALKGGLNDRVTLITKVLPVSERGSAATPDEAAAAAEISVLRSARALATTHLSVVLLHRARYLEAWDGAVWKRLIELRDYGQIEALGVSVSTPQEAIGALGYSEVTHIQLPANIIDDRWEQSGLPALLRRRRDIIVHARSPLLQGVLVRSADAWPSIQGYEPQPLIDWLNGATQEFGRDSIADLCLAYLRSIDWIDTVVVGMENCAQLAHNLALWQRPPLTSEERTHLDTTRPNILPDLLNPSAWPQPKTPDEETVCR